MSRVLAQLMGAAEPQFRTQLERLERAAGLPGADIRLMLEIVGQTRAKIRALGLDPHDTTGPELYAALKARLKADEARLRQALGISHDDSLADILGVLQWHLEQLPGTTSTFVVKQPVMRALIKKLQPKQTLKKLGYRSMDSMLKHEPVAQLLAAASVLESRDWQRRRLEAYKKLQPSDFEVRQASFMVPKNKNWPAIARAVSTQYKHDIMALPELGAVVLLPLEQDLPGLVITTLLLAVSCVNDMRSLGSYLKLQQVRPDYGHLFAEAIKYEPMTSAEVVGEPLPWKAIQWFYGHNRAQYHPDVFEPHVQPDDLTWHDGASVIAKLQPALEFWEGNQLLAFLDGTTPVSLNMLDVALSVCNDLQYGERIVHHMRSELGRELLARYLHQDNLQQLLLGQLDQQLAPELAF